jgi:spermidine synthase
LNGGARTKDYLVIAVLAFAVVLYEVAIIRVLSVVLWYHFAFLSISLAMLGLGVPGVWYALRPPGDRSLATPLIVAAVSIPVSVWAILQGGQWLPPTQGNWLFVALVVVCILVPMVSLGAGVCALLLRARGPEIGKMYGCDLLGAMAGTIVVLPLMFIVPTPLILAGAGLLPLVALSLSQRSWVSLPLGAALAVALVVGTPFEVTFNKVYPEAGLEHLFEKWTPTARITILPFSPFKSDQSVPWGWGYGENYQPPPLEQWWIDQDGSAGTPIENPDAALETLEHLFHDVTSVGYQLRRPQTVGIIGPGGGRDILTALKAGASEVDAVELNGAIVEALSSPTFRDFTGDVYHLPGVNAIVSEGRSYFTRTEDSYDLLQISLVDSWAATSAGAYALSENYLYTVEAFRLYYDRLGEDGLISVSRFLAGAQQIEGTRIALLALEALRSLGVEEPRRHVAMVRGGRIGTLLVSRRPWSQDDLDRLAAIASERGFDVLWPLPESSAEDSLVTRSIRQGPGILEGNGVDLSPPTDDRPFFFQAMSVLRGPSAAVEGLGPNEFAVVMLRRVVVTMIVLAAALYFLPFLLARRLERHDGFWRGSGYFAAIGLGFMLVELPWIQRFILFVGHPSYATSVVISALLLGASLGAVQAGRVTRADSAVRFAILLPLSIVATNFLLTPLFSLGMGWPLVARCITGWLVLLPAGFCMGFAFPIGMRRFGDPDKAWFWAMNGVMSVVGSVLSLGLAMAMGFSNVVLIGVAAYVVAWFLLQARTTRERTTTA